MKKSNRHPIAPSGPSRMTKSKVMPERSDSILPVYQKVYDILTTIPKGKVTTYGAIGKKLGINPRYIGRILHVNPNVPRVPCHRVVKSDGNLAGGYAMGGDVEQKRRLEEEGVTFQNDKVRREDII